MSVFSFIFISVFLLSACANGSTDSKVELFSVKKVIDGDTLILSNHKKVRFIGINTPELGHDRFKDEPLAAKAKRFVEHKINGKGVRLRYAKDKKDRKDRHGRILAHVFTYDGENIQTAILEQGLGFAVAVGKNFSLLDAYLAAQTQAKKAGKGVWAEPFFKPITAKKATKQKSLGYKRIRGKIKRISRSRKNQTLHLEGDFRVLIRRDNWKTFFKNTAYDKTLLGKKVEARGWIFKVGGVNGVKIYHPSMLEIL